MKHKRASLSNSLESPRQFPKHLLPLVFILYACLLPRELSFEIATVAFQPYKLALILAIPFVLAIGIGKKVKLVFADVLVFVAAFWIVVSLSVTEGFSAAVTTGLVEVIVLTSSYFAGRVCIRQPGDVRTLLIVFLPGLFALSIILAIESLGGTHLVRPFLADMLGSPKLYASEDRWGMLRAQGTFSHPILVGLFLASFLPIVFYLAGRPIHLVIGIMGVLGFFFSLSSTSFLAFLIGIALIATHFAQKMTRAPLLLTLLGAIVIVCIGISIFSENGLMSFVVRRMTIDASTGYYRIHIWQYAGAEIAANPLFGIGLRTYARPAWMVSASVDSFWLLITLRYGYPVLVSILVTTLLACYASFTSAKTNMAMQKNAGFAVGFCIILLGVTGLSVFLWEGAAVWFHAVSGAGIALGQIAASSGVRRNARPSAPRRLVTVR